ncbi:protein kinase [Streptomyces sp. NBC_00513]|uniref:serine/threonine-protein kinase n=1 Tax=unclassified Streptomyces TaxID=2593676 RepID=UPI002251E01D|nr:serine/threonine-protein kinase [Streptomyces sp. NBC_00424]MCX5079086.1 protein kinase [Streptomyces sp. NBC_00424]WUD39348.1 protein kinase [Streptomyces sp. NBC_00513]
MNGAGQVAGANGAELVGEVLGGRYRVTAMIGRGGMGVVARAVDQLLNREVAVKVLRAYTDASPAELADLRVRMQREAQAAARIRHSGVVTVHDVVEERGLPVIVMELVDGPSLDEVLAQRGPIDPREAAAIGAKLMDALDAAHRAGVLHRDVKPGNVLLEPGGRVVLTDFGIASMETSGDEALAKLTQSGQIVGSLDYLPPERAQGREPGAASDIWALGMTLYAAVEGSWPFRRTSVWSTLAAIVGEPLPEPRRAGPLAPVLQALMAKNPLQRPDAGQARRMLEAVAEVGTADLTPAPAPQPITPPAFGPPAAPFSQPAPQSVASYTPIGAYGAPPQPGAVRPGTAAGTPDGHRSRSETRATVVPGRGRRTRTVVTVAAATVLTCGGVAYALMDTRGDARGGGSSTAHPTPSTAADGDVSDDPPSPGDLSPIGPGETPSIAPSKKAEGREKGSSPTPGNGGGGPATNPSDSPKARTSSPVKDPTPVSKACTGWAHSNRSNGYGYAAQETHLYTGPYAECSFVTAVKPGVKVYYHCYVTNAHGNKWIYARIDGTNTAGWLVSDKSTLKSGTLTRC